MAEIINLRQARKVRDRAASERQAEENRAKFGRTKGEKARDGIEADRKARLIDGAKLEKSEDKEGDS